MLFPTGALLGAEAVDGRQPVESAPLLVELCAAWGGANESECCQGLLVLFGKAGMLMASWCACVGGGCCCAWGEGIDVGDDTCAGVVEVRRADRERVEEVGALPTPVERDLSVEPVRRFVVVVEAEDGVGGGRGSPTDE